MYFCERDIHIHTYKHFTAINHINKWNGLITQEEEHTNEIRQTFKRRPYIDSSVIKSPNNIAKHYNTNSHWPKLKPHCITIKMSNATLRPPCKMVNNSILILNIGFYRTP